MELVAFSALNFVDAYRLTNNINVSLKSAGMTYIAISCFLMWFFR